jgi:hypothetical protein
MCILSIYSTSAPIAQCKRSRRAERGTFDVTMTSSSGSVHSLFWSYIASQNLTKNDSNSNFKMQNKQESIVRKMWD